MPISAPHTLPTQKEIKMLWREDTLPFADDNPIEEPACFFTQAEHSRLGCPTMDCPDLGVHQPRIHHLVERPQESLALEGFV